MKALVLDEGGAVSLQQVPDPELADAGDAVIRVTSTSICGSDLHLMHGALPSKPPYVLGHEYVGVVTEVGAGVHGFAPGDRVVGPAAPWCGACAMCRRGQIQMCQRGGVFGSGPTFGGLGGAMAEFLRIPHADTVLSKIPDGVTDEQALLLGDVVSTGMTGVRHATTAPGGVLVVIGCGPVGLSAVHTARLFAAAEVIAVDRVPGRLRVAEQLGATRTIDASSEDVGAIVGELTAGRGADGVVEAVGLPVTIGQAVDLTGVGGRVAVVGIAPGAVELPLPQMLFKNLTLWSGLGDLGHIDTLLDQVARGTLDPSPMITDRVALDDIVGAIERFSDPANGVVKYAVSVG
ncbi:zinc-dependent alcohol dehydrogenase [Agromyces bauzanensis]